MNGCYRQRRIIAVKPCCCLARYPVAWNAFQPSGVDAFRNIFERMPLPDSYRKRKTIHPYLRIAGVQECFGAVVIINLRCSGDLDKIVRN